MLVSLRLTRDNIVSAQMQESLPAITCKLFRRYEIGLVRCMQIVYYTRRVISLIYPRQYKLDAQARYSGRTPPFHETYTGSASADIYSCVHTI